MGGGRILELLIENDWAVETLKALGGGHIWHLSYPLAKVDPAALDDIKTGALGQGAEGEILLTGAVLKRVATFETLKANDGQDFVRIDFRLLSVVPFVRDGTIKDGIRYYCRYRGASS
jgi:hypothetical protein